MKIFSKKQDDFFSLLEEKENDSIYTGEVLPEPSHALTAEEVLSSKTDTMQRFDSSGALDSLKKRMREATGNDHSTLLEKCKPYILDDEGKDASVQTEPAYTLESVDEILKTDEQKVIDKLAQKYDISFDYLGKYVEQKTAESIAEQPKIEPFLEPEPEPEQPEIEKEEFEDKIKISAPVKNIQSSVPFIISDIDSEISNEGYFEITLLDLQKEGLLKIDLENPYTNEMIPNTNKVKITKSENIYTYTYLGDECK